ncbi:hypothetical protein DKT74_25200 [Streptomyces sp. ZEA17I]|nr:hypothetical protein DKT74_25200 [Streptomyces sp. ZEA17I]
MRKTTKKSERTRDARGHKYRRTGLALGCSVVLVAGTACASPGEDRTGEDKKTSTPLLHGTVHIATAFDQPGFSFWKNRRMRGFDGDIAYYLAGELGFQARFQNVSHADRDAELEGNHAGMVIATYSITAARKKKVDFIGPYLTTKQGFLVRKDYNGIKTANDIAGKTICVVEGTTPEDVTMPQSTRVNKAGDVSACVEEVRRGGADATFNDEAMLYGYVGQNKPGEEQLKIVPNLHRGDENRYGVGIPKGHPEECKRILKVLQKFIVEQWSTSFRAQLPSLVSTYPDWENTFKPNPEDLNRFSSCQA